MTRKLTNDDYYQCMRVVRSAKLKGREKGVLRTYADWYYWPDQRPCIYGLGESLVKAEGFNNGVKVAKQHVRRGLRDKIGHSPRTQPVTQTRTFVRVVHD